MTLQISVDDVKREVKILRTLSGHENVVQFYASFEDDDLVYIVMEYASIISLPPLHVILNFGSYRTKSLIVSACHFDSTLVGFRVLVLNCPWSGPLRPESACFYRFLYLICAFSLQIMRRRRAPRSNPCQVSDLFGSDAHLLSSVWIYILESHTILSFYFDQENISSSYSIRFGTLSSYTTSIFIEQYTEG